MKKINNVFHKIIYVIKNRGIIAFLKQLFKLVEMKLQPSKYFNIVIPSNKNKYALFITGEPRNAVTFYRCEIPTESLRKIGMDSDVVYINNLEKLDLNKYKHIIWHRLPLSVDLNFKIESLKSRKKNIIFSIDDLLFDLQSIKQQPWFNKLLDQDKQNMLQNAQGILDFLQISDAAIASTDNLKKEMQSFVRGKVTVLKNTFSEKQKQIADSIPEGGFPENIFGFFSGSETHDANFKLIEPAIINLFEKFKDFRFLITGRLKIPNKLLKYKDRLIIKPFMNQFDLITAISEVGLNLVALEQNHHNDSKSEVRAVAAGLVARPTAATNILAFDNFITNGTNGFLVKNNEDWIALLEKAYNSRNKLKELGENANKTVMLEYNPYFEAENLVNFLESI